MSFITDYLWWKSAFDAGLSVVIAIAVAAVLISFIHAKVELERIWNCSKE